MDRSAAVTPANVTRGHEPRPRLVSGAVGPPANGKRKATGFRSDASLAQVSRDEKGGDWGPGDRIDRLGDPSHSCGFAARTRRLAIETGVVLAIELVRPKRPHGTIAEPALRVIEATPLPASCPLLLDVGHSYPADPIQLVSRQSSVKICLRACLELTAKRLLPTPKPPLRWDRPRGGIAATICWSPWVRGSSIRSDCRP